MACAAGAARIKILAWSPAISQDDLVTNSHPLDPLSADEIRQAAAILRRDRKIGDTWRFASIELKEPSKDALASGQPGAREAIVVCWDRADGQARRAILSLTGDKVTNWEDLPGQQPNMTVDEWHECDEMLRAHPAVAAALTRRGITDMSLVTEAFEIDDAESFATVRELLRKEGIFGGSSTGTLVAGALHYCRKQTKPKRVVSFVVDTGNKYLSKMYDDFWMADQGFIHRPPHGDLSDLISHRYEAGEVISVGPTDTLLTAFKRMRSADVSQVPVVDQHGRAIGILDESDVLVKVHRDPSHFNDLVKNAMTDRLETLPPNAKIKDLLHVFDRGRVAIVMEDDKFLGLVTRSDLLSYLRLHMPKQ